MHPTMPPRLSDWWSVVRRSLAEQARRAPPTGFVYTPAARSGPADRVATGTTILGEHLGAPWVAVSHTLDDVIVAGWPGQLWFVEILEAAPSPPRQGAGSTRAVSVRVLEECSTADLFGPHGAEVCQVIQAAGRLTEEQVDRLGAATSAAAGEAYTRAWASWITRQEAASRSQRREPATRQAGAGGRHSPIGYGLSVVHDAVFARARAVGGDEVLVPGEEETSLIPRWATAADALLQAALALGAPEVMPEADRKLLLSAFVEACGPLG
jgi:hypothetical protein